MRLPGGPSMPEMSQLEGETGSSSPSQEKPAVGSVKDENQVKSDVSSVGWKEIVLTREEFDRLSDRLNNPVLETPLVKNNTFVFLLPLCFSILYGILIFKDDFVKVPEVVQSVLKFLLFILTVYYITNDNTLIRMGVNLASRLLIAFCFAVLLVAASTVV